MDSVNLGIEAGAGIGVREILVEAVADLMVMIAAHHSRRRRH